MQHLLLRAHVRNYINQSVWNFLISSAHLQFLDCGRVKYGFCSKYSTSCAFKSSQCGKLSGLCEVEVVLRKINVGCSESEVLSALVNDEDCEAICLSHNLVDALLCRFKNDWKSAFGVFRWAESRPHFEHLPEAYDLMVDALGKVRQFDKMMVLVAEMQEKNFVSLTTVAKMMRRFSGARQWRDAISIFDKLGSFGLEKNAESMNLLLDTLCKENQVEMARDIFLELKGHIAPTLHTFNIFIHGWCKIKRVEEAHWTIQEMKGHGYAPCVISYSIIIKSYCQLSNWSKVYELLDEMETEGCQPTIVTYTTIISSLTNAGEPEEALTIADRVKSSLCKLDTMFYNALIHTLGKARRLEEAFDVFKVEMPRNAVTSNTETYNTLIAMFCFQGQEDMAFKILNDMEKSAACKPDLQTFYPLLKACFRLSMTDSRLSKLLDDMATKHHLSLDDSTYSLLIHGLCRVGECEWAFQLFEEMINTELTPRYQTCCLLMNSVAQKNMYGAVERVAGYITHWRALRRQKFSGSRASFLSFKE